MSSPGAGWLALPPRDDADVAVKPAAYLPAYEELLAPLRDQPISLLELGIWTGDSLEMWRDCLPQATVVGVDLQPPDLDLGERVVIARGDQSDGAFLHGLRAAHAPGGFDVIIDDASHLGQLTARSLQHLYSEHLKPGGLYVIEDWGTGYLPSWPDGASIGAPLDVENLDAGHPLPDEGGISMPSHDVGMVGVVKRLVDHVAAGTIAALTPALAGPVLPIDSMTIRDGLVVLRKPSA